MPRLFVAIDIPPENREALSRLAAPEIDARWTPAEQYHLTLRFLGHVDDETAERIGTNLSSIRSSAFRATIEGLDVFPSVRRPRVLVALIDHAPDLMALQDAIDHATKNLGIKPDRKAFNPHVTIARFRDVRPLEVRRYLDAHAAFRAGQFDVGTFHLYRSDLSPKGAKHTVLETYPLDSAG